MPPHDSLPPDVARLHVGARMDSLPPSAGVRKAVADYAARYLVRPCACHEAEYRTLESAINQAKKENESRANRAYLDARDGFEGRLTDAEVERHLERLGAPDVQRGDLFRLKLDKRPPMAATREWWAQRKDFPQLTLFSPGGSGKTLAGVWALEQWVRGYRWQGRPSGGRQTQPAFFITAATLAEDVFNEESRSAVRRTAFLVLDEVAGSNLTGPAEELLGDLLDYRYSHSLPTVFTANTSLKKFEERFDGARPEGGAPGRLTRRLLDKGWVLDGLVLRTRGKELKRYSPVRAVEGGTR